MKKLFLLLVCISCSKQTSLYDQVKAGDENSNYNLLNKYIDEDTPDKIIEVLGESGSIISYKVNNMTIPEVSAIKNLPNIAKKVLSMNSSVAKNMIWKAIDSESIEVLEELVKHKSINRAKSASEVDLVVQNMETHINKCYTLLEFGDHCCNCIISTGCALIVIPGLCVCTYTISTYESSCYKHFWETGEPQGDCCLVEDIRTGLNCFKKTYKAATKEVTTEEISLTVNNMGPLHYAVWHNKEFAVEVLAKNMDVNAKTDNGLTAIDFAIVKGNENTVRTLLECGADIKHVCCCSINSTQIAKNTKKVNIIDLLKHFKPTSQAITRQPTQQASSLEDAKELSVVKRVRLDSLAGYNVAAIEIRETFESKKNLLHIAAESGSVLAIDILVKEGLDVNSRDSDGHTPMHLAIIANKPDCVSKLLLNGAKYNLQDNFQETPHDIATRMNLVSIIEMLKKASESPSDNIY